MSSSKPVVSDTTTSTPRYCDCFLCYDSSRDPPFTDKPLFCQIRLYPRSAVTDGTRACNCCLGTVEPTRSRPGLLQRNRILQACMEAGQTRVEEKRTRKALSVSGGSTLCSGFFLRFPLTTESQKFVRRSTWLDKRVRALAMYPELKTRRHTKIQTTRFHALERRFILHELTGSVSYW